MNLLNEARRLHDAGYDLIPLNGKRPFKTNWTKAPRLSWEQLSPYIKEGCNLGIRLGHKLPEAEGYLACIDVDVVDELTDVEATQILELVNSVAQAPQATTGYGHGSHHLYVACVVQPKTQILGKAERRVQYQKAGETKTGPVWTVELRGLGAQTVLPPSVHPDTQTTYTWQRGRKLNGAAELPVLALKQETKSRQPRVSKARAKQQFEDGKSSVGPQSTQPAAAIDPQQLPIAPLYRHILSTGDVSEYPSRSEALYAVISALVRDTELANEEIEALILSQPIGEKARERPTGWVAGQCQKLQQEKAEIRERLEKLEPGQKLSDIQPLLHEAGNAGLGAAEREEILKLAKKVTGISKAALTEELNSSADNSFSQRARLAQGDPVYQEVMERHFLVSWGGKPAVFRTRKDAPMWESRYDVMTINSLTTFYENKPVMLGRKVVNPVEIWRSDARRQEFLEGARMIPPDEDCPHGIFNLWQGFAVKPKKASVSPWTDFIKHVICNGHADYASWLEDWIADMFQNVGNPKGVAVVLRGDEGIGKGTFANTLGAIVGAHYRHVTQESQLTGRFNGHFADSTLIFADELIWGGDKKHRGTLYAIVTEKHLMVERKNFDAVPMRNLNRMIIASNNEWVVPTGMDGRRWFVLDVSNKYKRNTGYFEKLRIWLQSKEGYAAILHHYLSRKIRFDLRKAPVTQALIDQKIAGFDSVTAWWHSVLERGCIRTPVGDATSEWELSVSKELIRGSYHTFCRDHGIKPQYDGVVIKRLHQLADCKAMRIRDGERRVHVMEFPELSECREQLQKMLEGVRVS